MATSGVAGCWPRVPGLRGRSLEWTNTASGRFSGLIERLGRLPRWWKLVALCAGLNLTEMGLVAGFDHGTIPALAPQASAIAPFGVFGDLRWVSVYHNSWISLAAEVVAMLAVRGLLTAVPVALAWPAHLPRPPLARLMWRAIFATALASVLLAPSVTLLYGLAVMPVSWLFLAAVPAALMVAFIIHPVAVNADWWRRPLSVRAVAWVLWTFVTLSAASALMTAVPLALWPLVSVLSGLSNAWAWTGLVRAVADRPPARHIVPMAGIALLGLLGAIIGGPVIGFDLARKAQASTLVNSGAFGRPGQLSAVLSSGSVAVLVVSGYGSSWRGGAEQLVPGPFIEERFSYKGLDSTGRPVAYSSADTVKPILMLDRLLIAQVRQLHVRTGLPVDVVAESEGALVAKTALLADPSGSVRTLVLASPLEDPGRVWYPAGGGGDGWGVASDEAMRLISDAFQGVAPINLSPDNELFASLDDEAPVLGSAMSCPINGVRQFALLPLADATVTPAAGKLPFPTVVLPAFHGGLLENSSGERIVSQILADRPAGENQLLSLADEAISYAASGWQVPSLVASDYPKDASKRTGSLTCNQLTADLRKAVGVANPTAKRP